jgi:hypothetical protein
MKKVLKANYEKAVQGYVKEFCKRTDLRFEDWVDGTGGNVLLGDYYFNFDDIKYHIDNNLNNDLIFDWYDVVVSRASLPTYKEFISLRKLKRD